MGGASEQVELEILKTCNTRPNDLSYVNYSAAKVDILIFHKSTTSIMDITFW